jgi:HSP20 family molecular chaperone IbpA
MRFNKALVWALGGLLTLGLVVQSVLLWQTRQELAALRGDEADLPNSIEERLLAQLDAQQSRRAPAIGSGSSSSAPLSNSPFDLFGGFSADPFTRMEQMRQQMNSVFGNSFSGISGLSGMQFTLQSPEIALEETSDEFRVRIQVPERHEIDLQTEVEDQQVTVFGKVTAESSSQNGSASSQMLSSSQFSRRFDLPGSVDELGVHTIQDEQGLVVVIPKKSSSV